MSMKINFDINNIPENPTLILAHRNGDKIDKIVAENIVVRDSMINPAEISFKVRKFLNNKKNILWDQIVNFKLVWYKEADLWFEIYVEIDESNETIKNVSCTQLGQTELSQIMLHNVEINTENDIARDEYLMPTVLYNIKQPEASLLHRITEKASHYSIAHVDSTIINIQRTFTFDNISIYDAFQQIAKEIGCLFVFNSCSDNNGKIQRTISVYDLESNCKSCGHRGEFTAKCPECGSSNIYEGYGNDTTIFITSDELADDIKLSTDTGSVKNCFKLEAGDDLMTATIRNCNPNGTDYIWYISEDVKADMSKELVNKIESYDTLYETYQNDYIVNVNSSILTQYNNLVKKYQTYNKDLQLISSHIKGYPALMTALYNTIDLSLFLESALMPDATMSDTNATQQVALLTAKNLSPVAVTDISNVSLTTANNAVLSSAKVVVDSRYRVKVNNSSLTGQTWNGNFVVTNYSDEEDTAISSNVSVIINDDYQNFVQQKINKTIKEKDTEDLSITGLFKLDYNAFCNELKKYSLNRLNSFYDACQACIDILIEQGVADSVTWSGSDPNLYNDLYTPYYQKLKAIESELKIRQSEIDLINGVYDSDGNLTQNGLQPYLNSIKEEIQEQLDFQKYIGDRLWLEFCSYRREDKYSNDNYISDGLNNSELFEKALEFIKVAKNEIYKSAELQHSISSSLKNLLVMEKFKPLVKYFETGNWMRIMVDDSIYKLRLLEYEIDFSNIDSLSVDFSDVLKTANGESDQKSIMSKVVSMTSSYDSVQKQATQGFKSNEVLNTWFNDGLDATLTKIIGGADNQSQTWDSHGMLFRKYNPITDTYDDTQLKIVNSTMVITDDNWKSTKTAVGAYYYFHPETKKLTMAYGINAEVLVGKLILGEQLGIYNDSGSLSFNNNGFVITNGINSFRVNPNSEVLLAISNENKDVFYIDENGKLHISGDGSGLDVSANSDITNLNSRITQTAEKIETEVTNRTNADNNLSSRITQTAESITSEVTRSKEAEENLSSRITQNANSITTEVTNRTNADNNLSSRITQTAEEINFTVKSIQIGGRNLVQNSKPLLTKNFVIDSSSTVASGIVKGTVSEIEDDGSFKITNNNSSVRVYLCDYLVASAGQSFAVSFKHKLVSGENKVQVQMLCGNSNKSGIYYASSYDTQRITYTEDDWEWVQAVFTIPEATKTTTKEEVAYVRFAIRTGYDNTAYTCDFYIKEPQVEYGNYATDWSPSPEDVEAEFSIQSDKINAKVSAYDENGNLIKYATQEWTTNAITSTVSNEIDGVESKITQTESSILAEVANIQIGGRNLIALGTDDIIDLNDSETVRNLNQTYYNKAGMHLRMLPFTDDYSIIRFLTQVAVEPGEYMLSFWCWTYGIDVQPTVRCNLWNGKSGTDNIDHYFKDIQPTANTPVKYEVLVNIDYGEKMQLRFVCGTKFTTGYIYFSDVKFERGNKATDWTPAPEDVSDEIDAVRSAVLEITPDYIVQEVRKSTDYQSDLASVKVSADEIVSTVTSSTTYKNDLDAKADTSVVTQTATAIRSEVSNADSNLQSQITQNANDIKLRITSTEAQSLIDQSASSIRLEVNNTLDDFVPDKLSNSSIVIDTNGIKLSGGTISVQSGVSFLVNSGGTVKISAGDGDNSYITLGEAFSVSQNGVSASIGNFTSLQVNGKKVLTEDSIGLDSKIVISSTEPSGNGIIWVCPTSVNSVSYKGYTADSRDATLNISDTTQIFDVTCNSADTLPNSTYKYTIKFPIILIYDNSQESNVKFNITATKASDSNLKVTFPEYIVASINEWEQKYVEVSVTSSTNLCSDTGAINITITTSNVSTNNLYVQKESYIDLVIADTNASGSVQACSVYYKP